MKDGVKDALLICGLVSGGMCLAVFGFVMSIVVPAAIIGGFIGLTVLMVRWVVGI